VATFYAGYSTDEVEDGNYAGVVMGIGDNATFTLSWAEVDEAWGPEFYDGTSAYITVDF